MTTLVLLVLAIVWAAVLASWVRSRTAGGFGDSVGTFRRHLTVLERAAPSTVQPANRMRAPASVPVPPYRMVPAGGYEGARVAARGSVTYAGPSPVPAHPAPAPAAPRRRPLAPLAPARRPGAPTPVSVRRRRSQKRRRDVLAFLLAAAVGTLLLSLIPGLRQLLYANVIFDVLLAAYVALLIRLRNVHAEREMKLTFLPSVRAVPAGMVLRGTGRYASMATSVDTGELLLHRAAN